MTPVSEGIPADREFLRVFVDKTGPLVLLGEERSRSDEQKAQYGKNLFFHSKKIFGSKIGIF